jgi:hypothetical protein
MTEMVKLVELIDLSFLPRALHWKGWGSVCLVNISYVPLISLIERRRKLAENVRTMMIGWETKRAGG